MSEHGPAIIDAILLLGLCLYIWRTWPKPGPFCLRCSGPCERRGACEREPTWTRTE